MSLTFYPQIHEHTPQCSQAKRKDTIITKKPHNFILETTVVLSLFSFRNYPQHVTQQIYTLHSFTRPKLTHTNMRLKTPEAFATTRRNLNAQHTCEAKTSSLPNERARRRPRDDNKSASKYNWPLSRAECFRLTDYTVFSLAAHSGQ